MKSKPIDILVTEKEVNIYLHSCSFERPCLPIGLKLWPHNHLFISNRMTLIQEHQVKVFFRLDCGIQVEFNSLVLLCFLYWFLSIGRHFNYLMKKYGSPIVVLNLMKKTEEKGRRDRRREGILSDEFRRQVPLWNIVLSINALLHFSLIITFFWNCVLKNLKVEYLNQFLPEEHAIEYISFDMAKCKKRYSLKQSHISTYNKAKSIALNQIALFSF